MKTFAIDLEPFSEEICRIMEEVQDGHHGHIVEFEGNNEFHCAQRIGKLLVPFIKSQLKEIK